MLPSGFLYLASATFPERTAGMGAGPLLFCFSYCFCSPSVTRSFGHSGLRVGDTASHNPEDLQHKTLALILLAFGIMAQRARGVLKSAWAGWVFPVLEAFDSVLLLFHEHHTGMHQNPMLPNTFHVAVSNSPSRRTQSLWQRVHVCAASCAGLTAIRLAIVLQQKLHRACCSQNFEQDCSVALAVRRIKTRAGRHICARIFLF